MARPPMARPSASMWRPDTVTSAVRKPSPRERRRSTAWSSACAEAAGSQAPKPRMRRGTITSDTSDRSPSISGSPVEEPQATTIWASADRNIWARSTLARRSTSSPVRCRSASSQRRRPARCRRAVTAEKRVRPTRSEMPATSPWSFMRSMDSAPRSVEACAAVTARAAPAVEPSSSPRVSSRAPVACRSVPLRRSPRQRRSYADSALFRRCRQFMSLPPRALDARDTPERGSRRHPGRLRQERPNQRSIVSAAEVSEGVNHVRRGPGQAVSLAQRGRLHSGREKAGRSSPGPIDPSRRAAGLRRNCLCGLAASRRCVPASAATAAPPVRPQ